MEGEVFRFQDKSGVGREWSDDIGKSHFVSADDVCCFLLFVVKINLIFFFVYRAFWLCAYVPRASWVNGDFAVR